LFLNERVSDILINVIHHWFNRPPRYERMLRYSPKNYKQSQPKDTIVNSRRQICEHQKRRNRTQVFKETSLV
jgi:hypothetical protein